MTTWFLRITDRYPFFVGYDKNPPLPDVRDCYLCQQHGSTGSEMVLWAVEKPLAQVVELYQWAISVGVRVVYDYGTTDEKLRRPTGIPELDGVPLPQPSRKAKGGIFS